MADDKVYRVSIEDIADVESLMKEAAEEVVIMGSDDLEATKDEQ